MFQESGHKQSVCITKRDHFTRHGLHMNGSGKDWIERLLATKIRQILRTCMPKPPIHLTWKVEASKDDTEARKVKEVRNSPSHESDLTFKRRSVICFI